MIPASLVHAIRRSLFRSSPVRLAIADRCAFDLVLAAAALRALGDCDDADDDPCDDDTTESDA